MLRPRRTRSPTSRFRLPTKLQIHPLLTGLLPNLTIRVRPSRQGRTVTDPVTSWSHQDLWACHNPATFQEDPVDLTFHLKDQTELLLTSATTPTFPSAPFPVFQAAKRHQDAQSASVNARSIRKVEEEAILMEVAFRDSKGEDSPATVVLVADSRTPVFLVAHTEAFPKVAIPKGDPKALRDLAFNKEGPKWYRKARTFPRVVRRDQDFLRKDHKGPTFLKDKEYLLIRKLSNKDPAIPKEDHHSWDLRGRAILKAGHRDRVILRVDLKGQAFPRAGLRDQAILKDLTSLRAVPKAPTSLRAVRVVPTTL